MKNAVMASENGANTRSIPSNPPEAAWGRFIVAEDKTNQTVIRLESQSLEMLKQCSNRVCVQPPPPPAPQNKQCAVLFVTVGNWIIKGCVFLSILNLEPKSDQLDVCVGMPKFMEALSAFS